METDKNSLTKPTNEIKALKEPKGDIKKFKTIVYFYKSSVLVVFVFFALFFLTFMRNIIESKNITNLAIYKNKLSKDKYN